MSVEEREFLEKNYAKMTTRDIADVLGITKGRVRYLVQKYQIKKKPPWTTREINFLRQNYNKMTLKELAKKLGRSKNAVRFFLRRMEAQRLSLQTDSEIEAALEADRVKRRQLREKWKKYRKKLGITGSQGLLEKVKAHFRVGDMVQVSFQERGPHVVRKKQKGRVLLVRDRFMLVKFENWKECINFGSLIDGAVIVEELEQRKAGVA